MTVARWQDTPEWRAFMRGIPTAGHGIADDAGPVAVAGYREQLRHQIRSLPMTPMLGGVAWRDAVLGLLEGDE